MIFLALVILELFGLIWLPWWVYLIAIFVEGARE